MYTISSIKSKRTLVCPGDYAYDAEAMIFDSQNKEFFVHVSWALDETFYSCSNTSKFDYITGATDEEPESDHIEEFQYLEDACNSKFIDIYRMLDKLLYDMFHGPKKMISQQAQMLSIKTEANVMDEDNYYFAVIQSLEYDGQKYEATFANATDGEISIILKQGETTIEKYEDLEIAAHSEWFMLYCNLKDELVKFITDYFKEHRDCELNYSWVMRELWKDY